MILRTLAIALAALSPALVLALDLPHESAVPGGVKIIRLDTAGSGARASGARG